MYLSFQMMGLAFEVHDSVLRSKKLDELQKKKDATNDIDEGVQLESEIRFRSIKTPSAEDIFHYAFCHAGILTGIDMFERNKNYITRYFNGLDKFGAKLNPFQRLYYRAILSL